MRRTRTQPKPKGLFRRLAELNDRLVAIRDPRKALLNARMREANDRLGYINAERNRIRPSKIGLGGTGDSHARHSDLWTLREYSRDLDRNNVIASAMLDRASEAIIGSGIDLQLQSGNKRWDQEAEKMFRRWWDTEADIRGLHLGWQIENLAYRSMKVDGDILFIKTDRGAIQAIEGDRIASPYDLVESDGTVVNGVKVDAYGRPEGFWVAPEPIRNQVGAYGKKKDFTFYDAKYCVFLANMNRFSLTRGVPVFATNMQLFDDLDSFIETCIIHAKVATAHVLFVERENGLDDLDGVETVTDSYDYSRQEQITSPGQILYGKPGESAKGIGSTQSMVQFGPFVTQLLRFAGLNFGMPLEMLSLDFSRTNYSSARAALLVAHKSFVAQHRQIVKRFLEPIVRWKVDRWIRARSLDARPNGYRVTATPPRMISVDPLKESAADVSRVQHGHSSNQEVCGARGLDWEDVMQQRAAEIDAAMRRAAQLSKKGLERVSWRDILGDAKNFDAAMYQNPDAPSTPTGGNDE